MLSWLGRKTISHNMRRPRESDVERTLRLDPRDIHFRFPGENSWATGLRGKESLRAWLRRFVEVGLQIHADEVVLKGVSENRCVIWATLRWGLLREHEVYEDAEGTRALDACLGAGP